jgi:hypothetical protein
VSVPYTTADLVGGVVEVDDGDDLTPFIRSAHRLIVRFCEPFLNNGTANAYTADDLTDIETWLAAHFYACLSRQTRSEQAGTVRADYESKVDLHLDVTIYGQQAMVLDPNGGLASWNNRIDSIRNITAEVLWLGVDEDED